MSKIRHSPFSLYLLFILFYKIGFQINFAIFLKQKFNTTKTFV
ncbi:hypothetical protein CSUNSWCD_761 [Campylobacter showae CSUNSWCD]|uniref:Uncharacterized protein n=1 Tax=Campylobacter showae CSUNSWCD TaxID=1244083 RepID=M5IHY0_9BACT|nr:hypothetical protein CSUNSWCD_761 [Campylobacter showae CSUNSWCD]